MSDATLRQNWTIPACLAQIAALEEEVNQWQYSMGRAIEERDESIAALAKVAEAAAAYRGYFCEIETHRQRERTLDKALRDAGF